MVRELLLEWTYARANTALASVGVGSSPLTRSAGAVVLTDEMQRVVLEQRLGFVATVCRDGTPNLSPKGTTTVWDDTHLVFADIRSPRTVLNLRENPAIEINMVDPIVRKGYRFKGRAELHSSGEVYEKGLRLLAERDFAADRARIRTIVLVTVEQAAALVSPAYDSSMRPVRTIASRVSRRRR
jgi:uncharacterized protein